MHVQIAPKIWTLVERENAESEEGSPERRAVEYNGRRGVPWLARGVALMFMHIAVWAICVTILPTFAVSQQAPIVKATSDQRTFKTRSTRLCRGLTRSASGLPAQSHAPGSP